MSNANGYVYVSVPGHPRATGLTHRVYEHIVVMEQMMGRYLEPGEVVHHINEVKDDNRPENLMLFPSHAAHMRHHADLLRAERTHCKSGLHEWSDENVSTRKDGRQECIACRNAAARRRHEKKRRAI